MRVDWIDLTKGIAIFLMVCGHIGLPGALSNWIWSFHMPLFFLMSGLLYIPCQSRLLIFHLKNFLCGEARIL